jgi:hypothetical protein
VAHGKEKKKSGGFDQFSGLGRSFPQGISTATALYWRAVRLFAGRIEMVIFGWLGDIRREALVRLFCSLIEACSGSQ